MRNKIFFLFLLFVVNIPLAAQELNCRVTVNAERVQSSDRSVFKDMETSFTQFLNNQQWSSDVFESHEQINCNIIITLADPTSIGNFEADVQIQSARPVFDSNYESIMFNFADRDWQFEYVLSQPLQYNDNTFLSNLTSLLAYYAYILVGIDYDSFSELGGTEYFQKALNIVNNAQQANRPGWDALGSTRNRYWLTENFTNQQMIDLRKGIYKYHRLALDTFGEDPDNSRKLILEVLRDWKKIRGIYPNSILIIALLDAKGDELINIFSEGSLQVRREAYDILSSIDPSKSSDYEKIIKSN